MPERCLACRAEIPGAGNVCFTCGACYDSHSSGLRGRPRAILIARWTGVGNVVVWALSTLAASGAPDYGVAISMIVLLGSAVGVGFGAAGYAPRLVLAHLFSFAAWLLVLAFHILTNPMLLVLGMDPTFLFMIALTVAVAAGYGWAWMNPLRPSSPMLCSSCGYVLMGLAEPRCPECGVTFNPAVVRRAMQHAGQWMRQPDQREEPPAYRRVG